MLRLDWNLVWTIINLVIWCILIKLFLLKPVRSILEQRKASIDQQLANANDAEMKARELKSRYEADLQSTYDESAKLMEQAKANARLEYERIVKEADEKAGKIIRDAHQAAELDREKTLQEAESEISGLAMDAALKILGEKSGTANDSRLYHQFLAGAGDPNDTDFN